MASTNYGITVSQSQVRTPVKGQVCFTGVVRDIDVDETILNVEATVTPNSDYSLNNIRIITNDNTGLANNTVTGSTYNNNTSYLILFDIDLKKSTSVPIVTTSAAINLTGIGSAIIRQLYPFQLSATENRVQIIYAIVVDGATQKDSNDLIEAIFTETTNPFFSDQPLNSCINFVLNF